MIHGSIGYILQKILPKLVPRNDKDVDELLNCKLRVYVLIFCIFCILCIFENICVRLKKNGTDVKEIPLIGQGFQALIDDLFWFLPFSSKTQAEDLRDKMELPEDCWVAKREEVKAEHLLEQAAKDLKDGWKAWIAENGSGTGGDGAGAASSAVPVGGVTSRMRSD